ncbi:MAG: diguanylate cyclase [Aestuariibacter sp.]
MFTIRNFIFCIFVLVSGCATAAEIVVRHNYVDPSSSRDQWPIQLLDMAFSYQTENTYRTESIPEPVNQERLKTMLNEGSLSVMWIGTSAEIERQFHPIRIPVFKGLLGHRIFIIRKGDQARFSQVNSFSDLLKLKAGQGRFWSDTPILESAGIPVVKPVKYPNLFHMLDGDRFDYFPRAVHEPWAEVQNSPLNITVEKELMLVYPMPLYMFTSKNNTALADVIQAGLRRGIDDGTFDRLFLANPAIREALELTNMAERKIFRINNPGLSAATPLDDKSLWFDISSSGL